MKFTLTISADPMRAQQAILLLQSLALLRDSLLLAQEENPGLLYTPFAALMDEFSARLSIPDWKESLEDARDHLLTGKSGPLPALAHAVTLYCQHALLIAGRSGEDAFQASLLSNEGPVVLALRESMESAGGKLLELLRHLGELLRQGEAGPFKDTVSAAIRQGGPRADERLRAAESVGVLGAERLRRSLMQLGASALEVSVESGPTGLSAEDLLLAHGMDVSLESITQGNGSGEDFLDP